MSKRIAKSKTVNPSPLNIYQGSKKEQLVALYDDWRGCLRCQLGEIRRVSVGDDVVFGEGNPDAHILIVGEGPGAEEEKSGYPFVGESGKFLNTILVTASGDERLNFMLREYATAKGRAQNELKDAFHAAAFEWRAQKFFITNAVACRPPENRTPTANEIKACWERLWNLIYIVDPLVIVACGNSALAALKMKTNAQITKNRGTVEDIAYEGRIGKMIYPVIPVFHPSYLLRKADWKESNGDYQKTVEDWKNVLNTAQFICEQHGLTF